MGKAKIGRKLDGYRKQLQKHIDKFKEAQERGAVESMEYMAKEMKNFIKRMEILEKRRLPKRRRKLYNHTKK